MKKANPQARRPVGRFVLHVLRFSLPFALLLALYVAADVFKVIYRYDAFYPPRHTSGVSLNAGYVSTSTYDRWHARYGYDSFIFGNSRSIYYEVADWLRYLPAGSSCFHFDASSESLYGLERKVSYISRQGRPLRHALLVLDKSVLEQAQPKEGHLYRLPPRLEGPAAAPAFHAAFAKAFFSPRFLFALADFKLSGTVKPYMQEGHLITHNPFYYEARTNECRYVELERSIAQGTYYTPERLKVFEGKSHPDSVSPPVIGPRQLRLLRAIRATFRRHGTDCRIVISPLYDQIRLHPADLACLRRLFGPARVHDFSGTNAFTADHRNYYEASHYRPHVSRQILQQVYAAPQGR